MLQIVTNCMLQKETKGTRGARSSKLCGSASHAHSPRGWKLSRQSPAAEIGSKLIKIWCRNNREVGIPKITKVKGKNSTPRRECCLSSRPARWSPDQIPSMTLKLTNKGSKYHETSLSTCFVYLALPGLCVLVAEPRRQNWIFVHLYAVYHT